VFLGDGQEKGGAWGKVLSNIRKGNALLMSKGGGKRKFALHKLWDERTVLNGEKINRNICGGGTVSILTNWGSTRKGKELNV